MPSKVRLQGAASRVVRMTSDSAPKEITVTFAVGEDLPVGDLYATATSRGDVVALDVVDATGSDGVVTIVTTLDPNDFEAFGRRVWTVEVGTFDDGSGDNDTSYVLFSGSVAFEQVIPNVIASTSIQEAAS